MINIAVENTPRLKHLLHIIIALFLATAFILTIARIANKGSPRGRSTSYGLAVTIKGAISLAYQVSTDHVPRLQRWGSAKAYMILNYIEVVFWALLFGLSIQGAFKGCKGSACYLAGILAAVSFNGCVASALLALVCTRAWLFVRRQGFHPGTLTSEPETMRMRSTSTSTSGSKSKSEGV